MTDWTPEEDEAFNEVERHSNLGKQILRDLGQPYHWESDAIKAAVLAEREACAKVCEQTNDGTPYNLAEACAEAIRARGDSKGETTAVVAAILQLNPRGLQ